METTPWRKCNACKKPIGLGSLYYVCSVSTCNGQRTGYAFCSVSCFDTHVPVARHKDAAAIEMKAPLVQQVIRTVSKPGTSPAPRLSNENREALIIASRLKEYISSQSDFNTSGGVIDVLSDHIRILCERAIDNARADGRKTVMERDFQFIKTLK